MSSLIVEICAIEKIKEHTNSDFLEIAEVKGWQCVVRKEQYNVGDKIIYIPPDSILPIELAENLGIRNYLVGSNKDRVKNVKLRGEMSFGLIIDVPNNKDWKIGHDCKKDLGIIKYEPPVRTTEGNADRDDPLFERFTDIENIRNYSHIFKEGEEVIITEKIDGSQEKLFVQNVPTFLSKTFPSIFKPKIIYKTASNRIIRKKPKKDIEENIYWYPYTLKSVRNLLEHVIKTKNCKIAILYGEIYGKVRGGHKSMHYGKQGKLAYVAFGLKIDGKYMDIIEFRQLASIFNVPLVPLVSIIPFNFDEIKKLSSGNSLLAEKNGTKHLREGIVIVPFEERKDPKIGRIILKMLNDDYLLLKNKAMEKGEITDFTDV